MTDARLGHVVLPVADTSAAADFWSEAFGLTTKFKDGTRYAALDGGGATIALAAEKEQVRPGAVSVGIKVGDVDVAARRAVDAGARLVGDAVETDHDRRQAVEDPFGNIVVLYASK